MKSFSFAKALTLGCLVCLTLPVACGDDDDGKPNTPSGGSANGGAGTADAGSASDDGGASGAPGLPDGLSNKPSSETCGENMCESVSVAGAVYVDPCCAAGDACGLDTGFLELVGAQFTDRCQIKDQPGDVDDACPAAEGLSVPFQGASIKLDPFAGCCRPNGTCGVVVNNVTSAAGKLPLAAFGLGCIEGAPFFGGEVTTCGAGGGGNGGNGGAGGMGAGGEPATVGGAGGAGGAQ